LIKAIRSWDAGGLEIDVGVSTNNFSVFFDLLTVPSNRGDTHETINKHLGHRGCGRIRLLPPFAGDAEDTLAAPSNLDRVHIPVRLYQGAIDILQTTTVSVCSGGRIQFGDIQQQAERMVQSLQGDDGPMMSLAREEQYDAFTFGHSVRVSVLAMNFGRALTNDMGLLVRLGTAALLHDVGKSQIPFEILHSSRPLTEDERKEISRHPVCGAEILLDHEQADEMSIVTAFGHHRTMDFSGYPATVHEYRQSMVTRIVKICDVYEALTAVRPYKRPITPTRAYRIMLGMGKHFDQHLLRKFIEVNGIFPNGQLVEMNTGELARVQQQSSKLLLPSVELITDPEGNRLDEKDQRIIELVDAGTTCSLSIERALDEELFCNVAETVTQGSRKQGSAQQKPARGADHDGDPDGDPGDDGLDKRLDDPTYC
jgi:HD-GYP domain-containing protein (c-di-GMP phosphodiesterase class II)